MTEEQIVDLVAIAIPTDKANKLELAKSLVSSAILSIGRKNSVDFNQRTVTGNLISGTKEYIIGIDIFSGTQAISSLYNLHRTDTIKWPIGIIPKEEFYAKVGGYTNTGAPTLGTLEAGEGGVFKLVLYPVPDSAYPVKATVKVPVVKIQDIPDHYHDVIVSESIMLYGATQNPEVASVMLKRQDKSMEDDRLMSYSGKRIRVDFSISSTLGRGTRANSRNLTDN